LITWYSINNVAGTVTGIRTLEIERCVTVRSSMPQSMAHRLTHAQLNAKSLRFTVNIE
jgi:hypothetical protein